MSEIFNTLKTFFAFSREDKSCEGVEINTVGI